MDPALLCVYRCFEGLKNVGSWMKNGPTHEALTRDFTDHRVDFAGTDWALFWWLAIQKLIMAFLAGAVLLAALYICGLFGVWGVSTGF